MGKYLHSTHDDLSGGNNTERVDGQLIGTPNHRVSGGSGLRNGTYSTGYKVSHTLPPTNNGQVIRRSHHGGTTIVRSGEPHVVGNIALY